MEGRGEQMRYLIIGAGGTGGFMAANMAEAGLDVAVIARGEHLRQDVYKRQVCSRLKVRII